jgi:hypothetical protein
MNWHINFLQQRLDAANRIMEQQVLALSQAHAALVQAKIALEWYGAGAFVSVCTYPVCACAVSFPEGYKPSMETECPKTQDDGVTVGDRIDDALHELTH